MSSKNNYRNVNVEIKGDEVFVRSPYNTYFVTNARDNLGGFWEPELKAWKFKRRTLEKVKELLLFAYGNDGFGRIDQCDLLVTYIRDNNLISDRVKSAVIFLGYPLAQAESKVSGAKVFPGVYVTAGGFSSGGSQLNWKTTISSNTSFTLKRVSHPYYLQVLRTYKQVFDDGDIEIKVLDRVRNDEGSQTIKPHESNHRPIEQTVRVGASKETRTLIEVDRYSQLNTRELFQEREVLLDRLFQLTQILNKRTEISNGN